MRRIIISSIAAVGLLLGVPLAAPANDRSAGERPEVDGPAEQWRGFWADSFQNTIYTPENVDRMVDEVHRLGMNAMIVQVSRWMDCFCNKSTFPRTHVSIDPDFDPLEYVLKRAHAKGIEVHAWVNATPMWNATFAPPDPEHIYNTHGHDATGADKWLQVRSDGAEYGGRSLRNIDVANGAATDYVVEGIRSIVREYDVDGIHLDYIRYPDYNMASYQSNWGYSDVSIARFQAATGRTDVPEPTDPEFSQWRRDQVTNYVRKIYLGVYEEDPTARLSMAGITYWYGPQTEGGWEKTRTYSEVMQDWKGWLREGIMDTNVAMNYKVETEVGDRIQMYEEWNEVIKDWQFDRQAVVGPALYLNTVEDSISQAKRALEPSPSGNTAVGWNGYNWETPSNQVASGADRNAERAALIEGLTECPDAPFAEPAVVPSMPWKENPTTGHLSGRLELRDGTPLDQVEVKLTNLRTGEKVTGRVTDGAGWFGVVDLKPGRWLVEATLPRGVSGRPFEVIRVRAGKLSESELGPFTQR